MKINPIDKAFPAHQEFHQKCVDAKARGTHGYYAGSIENIVSEFTQLKSLCAEMGEALEKIAKPALGGKLQQQIAKQMLTKFQSVFKGE